MLHTKISSKWIKYLNITAETVKLLEGNIGIHFPGLEFGNGFLEIIPSAQASKQNIKILPKSKTFV